jgi:hypothetical protein
VNTISVDVRTGAKSQEDLDKMQPVFVNADGIYTITVGVCTYQI